MITTYTDAGTPVIDMTVDEYCAFLDLEVRARIGLSLDEFVARVNAGEIDLGPLRGVRARRARRRRRRRSDPRCVGRPSPALVALPGAAFAVGASTYASLVPISRSTEPDGVAATMPLRPSAAGGSGAFLVLANDGRRYWCKPLNNFQSPRVTITEQIVARLGALIGAPVCEPQLVRLDAIAGWELRPGSGRTVEAGWTHGSVAVDPALETRVLEHRPEDDNRRRHSGIYALCDWLAGSDVQWLYATDRDNAYFSHDHGFFLTGPDWTAATLDAGRDGNFAISVPPDGLDSGALETLADALEVVTREEIEAELSKLPANWPVSDEELVAVRDFTEHRAGPAAQRLRGLLA